MSAPMTPEQRKAIVHQLGDVKSATNDLIASFAEAVAKVREHKHPSWEDLYCMNLTSYMGERMAPVLRRLLDAEARVTKVERLGAQVAAVLALHRRHDDSEHCEYDGEVWPCPTVEALATPPVTNLADAVQAQGALPMPTGDAADPCRPCGCPTRFNRHAYGCPTIPEDPHDSPLHQSYATPHDLPEFPAQRDQRGQA